MLTAAALVLTAFVAGVTGAWSPCGLSMVETLGSATARVGIRGVRLSAATFALGALAGGVVTFATLGALGQLLHAGGEGIALAAAVAIALLAALGEALGVRVVPQIRRQVPEPWRRVMPLPLASGLYGILLGLGFTTFVLTLAVWALAGISVAIGSPLAGLLIGLGFGAGRALPVVVMAPRYATIGERLETRMALEPALLRRLRLADAALLTVLALTLLSAGPALAAVPVNVADDGTDPSLAGDEITWLQADGNALRVRGDVSALVPAHNVALGGPYVATRVDARITVSDRLSGAAVVALDAPGATQIAVSRGWLVWRVAQPGGAGDQLFAVALPTPAQPRLVATVRRGARIGRPALAGDRLAFSVATPTGSRIVVADLARNAHRVVLQSRLTQLSQPALRHQQLLYVEADYCRQRLRLTRLHGRRSPRTLLRIGTTAHRDSGHDDGLTTQGREPSLCPHGTPHRTDTMLWSTALGAGVAYVTLLQPRGAGQRPGTTLVRVRA